MASPRQRIWDNGNPAFSVRAVCWPNEKIRLKDGSFAAGTHDPERHRGIASGNLFTGASRDMSLKQLSALRTRTARRSSPGAFRSGGQAQGFPRHIVQRPRGFLYHDGFARKNRKNGVRCFGVAWYSAKTDRAREEASCGFRAG